jgi:DNA invertase Pin-like site-specific DNA recombinase
MTRIACAIYTRKSTDEGLEKEFNSLDAQREACEAYITSQKHAGWIAVREMYDDGGLSGGTMERPALKRLLADIKGGKVQIVVVYKVDRLTRSLADFAKIVDVLDAHGASFVSVTQQFNTTTSMGRLTLNMLLSFAQFEREIAGERIRDKIAASKAKGMWMGGTVPLGYDVKHRKLVVNQVEAETVHMMFRRYAELGSVTLLQEELNQKGIRSKRREVAGGRVAGGRHFSRGILYLILQNRLYRGQVAHKGNVYDGQHEAIIDAKLWDLVQAKLTSNRRERELAVGAEAPSLLSGLIYDSDGNHMTPTHANKRGKRYRYYISAPLLGRGSPGENPIRIPAVEVEGLVLDRVRCLLSTHTDLVRRLASLELNVRQIEAVLKTADSLTEAWTSLPANEIRALVQHVVSRVALRVREIEISISTSGLAQRLSANLKVERDAVDEFFVLRVAAHFRSAWKGKRIIVGEQIAQKPDPQCLKLMREAFAARTLVLSENNESLTAIAKRLGKCQVRLTGLVRLSYLAPSIVEDLTSGRHPIGLSAKQLLRRSKDLPLDWQQQRKFVGLE